MEKKHFVTNRQVPKVFYIRYVLTRGGPNLHHFRYTVVLFQNIEFLSFPHMIQWYISICAIKIANTNRFF